ncbi:MAG: hypothetical protein RI928_1288 [Pseudomonadota bacterium]|jgi:ankyrin repeat protein
MSTSNLALSIEARATSLNTATLPVQTSASSPAVDLGPNVRSGEALQVLYITSEQDFPKEVEVMEESFGRHQLNAGLLELSHIEGKDLHERQWDLKAKIAQLHKVGLINDSTVTIISMHGVDGLASAHHEPYLQNNQTDVDRASNRSASSNKPYMLSVMDGALEFDFHWLVSCVRNISGCGATYKGQIHLSACKAKRCMDLVAGDGFPYVAYGGRKTVLGEDARVTCLAVIDLLGHCHRDRIEFPSPEKIAEHAAGVSGSSVSVTTSEKPIYFSTLKSTPICTILNKSVIAWLDTKASRVLAQKLRHGSFASVQNAEEKFGKIIWSALDSQAAFYAIKSKRDVISKLIFLEKNRWSFEAKDHKGDSLLHKALKSEDLEVINFCIDQKLNTNAENNKGDRPLHYALTGGMVDEVKSLINGGANPSLFFVENGEAFNFLHYAVAYADNECIAAVLESPLLEINALGSSRNFTALHFAAFMNKSEAITLLAAKGADLNIMSGEGSTPLQLANKAGNVEAAKALIEAGASLSLAANDGERPSISAVRDKS